MKTGTDSKRARLTAFAMTICAAMRIRLPVTWATKRPPSPRKLMTSALPAITLRTIVSNIVPGELSAGRGETGAGVTSFSGDIVPDHPIINC